VGPDFSQYWPKISAFPARATLVQNLPEAGPFTFPAHQNPKIPTLRPPGMRHAKDSAASAALIPSSLRRSQPRASALAGACLAPAEPSTQLLCSTPCLACSYCIGRAREELHPCPAGLQHLHRMRAWAAGPPVQPAAAARGVRVESHWPPAASRVRACSWSPLPVSVEGPERSSWRRTSSGRTWSTASLWVAPDFL
jgi:hypothetical protein